MVIEVRTVIIFVGILTGKRHREPSGVLEIYLI